MIEKKKKKGSPPISWIDITNLTLTSSPYLWVDVTGPAVAAKLYRAVYYPAGTTLANNLVAYYKLEDTVDSSGNGYNLINNNGVVFNPGKNGNAADFGAVNSTKWLSTSDTLGIDGGAMSFAGWVNITTLPTGSVAPIFSQFKAGGNHVRYEVHYSPSGVLSFIRNRLNTPDSLTYNVNLGTGTWHHLVYTYDLTTVEGWVDGVSIGTVASSGSGSEDTDATEGFTLGTLLYSTDQKLSGLLDEVGVWSRKLSSAEIAYLYNGARP
ncbi:MAG: hypothetical protein A3J67_03570 [Parcubacteria group bacterium RIFCSPHIGHO2_02_FULL_48_10b]|nr:MAG: hypothetical protein A3J67_03570 [Parcubacteria group bacterium RIFCSPHIGHO2_02_FULL_48_10b]